MTASLSVIVCTHNPRGDYLRRTLPALEAQTLPRQQWELVIIDNASASPVANSVDLNWHPSARIIIEPALGLTRARLRGIAETTGEVVVFVDDDNVPAPDYLDRVTDIARHWPMLGAWGGRIEPEFETEPPAWSQEYWFLLAIAQFEQPRWSNQAAHPEALPTGAGQCVRREVARKYAENVATNPLRVVLDRVGTSLSSGGDIDLALTALDLDMGTGRFPELRLIHLIPASRLELPYLIKLAEGVVHSAHLMSYIRGKPLDDMRCSGSERLFEAWRRFRLPTIPKAFARAYERGRQRALRELEAHEAKL